MAETKRDVAAFRFTEASVEKICSDVVAGRRPSGRYRDLGSNVGLYLRAGPRGGVYVSIRRVKGKKHPLTRRIGLVATTRVATAREAAIRIAGGSMADINPVQSPHTRITAQEVFESYLVAAVRGTFSPGRKAIRQSTAKSYKELWRPHIQPSYGGEQLACLAGDIEKIHQRFADKPATQQRLMQVLKNVFEHAIRMNWWAAANPLISKTTGKPLRCGSVADRERFLSGSELVRFVEYAKRAEPPWADFWMLALATGQRLSTLASMQWEAIDLRADQPTWRISITKNGNPLVVPLLSEAVQILTERLRKRLGSERFVFPSARSKTGHLVNPHHRWKKMIEDTGLKDFRFHDLRRTAGTIAVQENSLPAVARFLGHRTLRAAAIYARAGTAEAEKVGRSVSSAIQQAIRQSQGDAPSQA